MSLRLKAIESEGHIPPGEEGDYNSEQPPRDGHVKHVLDDENM